MYKKNGLIIILFVIIFGCSNEKDSYISDDKLSVITIDLYNKSDLDIHQLVSELSFIPLETSDEFVIGNIDKLLYFDNKYIIADRTTHNIFVFSDSGKFISKIGSQGKGPFEYLTLRDIAINTTDSSLNVLAGTNPVRIIKYSLDNEHISDFKLSNLNADKFTLSCNNFILYNSYPTHKNSGYSLTIVDNDGDIISQYLPFNHYTDTYYDYCNFYSYNNYKHFNMLLDYNIYRISPQNIVSKCYYFDFGELKLPEEVKNTYSTNFEEFVKKSQNYISGIYQIQEIDNCLYFSFPYDGRDYQVFRSKSTGNMVLGYTTSGFLDSWISCPIGTIDNKFVAQMDPSALHNLFDYIKQNKDAYESFVEENENLFNLYKDTNKYSNPILIIYSLTSF